MLTIETTSNPKRPIALRQQEPNSARPVPVAPFAPCEDHHKAIRILRLPEVIERVGLRRASIYAHMDQGRFPKQVSLGSRAVGWLEHEIEAWLAARINARRT
jgi:prophage regulatory protein